MAPVSKGTRNPSGRTRNWTVYSLVIALVLSACVLVPALPAFAALKNVPDRFPGTNGTVKAVLRVGDTIYLGGEFQKVGTTTRFNLAAIDANTGALKAWNPRVNCCVKTLAASPDGTRIYAGGTFTTVGGSTRERVAEISAATGEASNAWSPEVGSAGTAVNALAVQGNRVFIGGTFLSFDGQPRRRLAMVSGADATLSGTWRPAVGGPVHELRVVGPRLYVGGSLRFIAGQPRRNLAALLTNTARPTAFRPKAPRPVLDLVAVGKRVYTAEGGLRGGAAAAYGTGTGRQAWRLQAAGDAQAVAVMDGRVFVGGHFSRLAGKTRYKVAAILPGSGKLDPRWAPRVNKGVWAITPDPGRGKLYIGGQFTQISGRVQSGIARFARLP